MKLRVVHAESDKMQTVIELGVFDGATELGTFKVSVKNKDVPLLQEVLA